MNRLGLSEWELIKTRHLGGDTCEMLAEEFGIKPQTIRLKCSKENWPTPYNLRKQAKELMEQADEVDGGDSAQEITKNWGEIAEQYRRKMQGILEGVVDGIKPEDIKVKSAHDLERVDAVVRRNSGLGETGDSEPKALVQFNLLSKIEPKVIDVSHNIE